MLERPIRRARRRTSAAAPARPRHRPIVEALEDRLLLASDPVAAADHLYISDTIATTAAGASLGTITVKELDVSGDVIKGDSTTVVGLYLADNPGGAQLLDASTEAPIATPITATLHDGVATFEGLALDKAGIGYLLGAQAVNDGAVLPATSNAFVVTAGAPAGLAFLAQPTFTDANTIGNQGQVFTINEYNPNAGLPYAWPGVVVGVVDRFGNQVTGGIGGGSLTMTAGPVGAPGTSALFNPNSTTTVAIDPATQVSVFSNLQWTGNVGQLIPNGYTEGVGTIAVPNATAINNLLKLGPVGVSGPGLAAGTAVTSADVSAGTITVVPAPTMSEPANTNLLFNNAGQYTLTASAQSVTYDGQPVSLAPATSVPFEVSATRRANLGFATGTAPPATAEVGAALPSIKVEVLDEWNQPVATDNSDSITLLTSGIEGTLTEPVVNGVATFDDLYIPSQRTTLANGQPAPPIQLNFQYQNLALGTVAAGVALTPGPAYGLEILNPYVGGQANGQVVAGAVITGSPTPGGALNPIQVAVVDQGGNIVRADDSTIVSVGLLPNDGRGAVFVGNSTTIYTPNDPRIPAPIDDLPAVPNSFDYQATAQVVGGVATFSDLYADYAGSGYLLTAGTASFASQVATTTQPFTLVPAAPHQIAFANQPGTSNTNSRLNFINPPNALITNVYGIAVAVFDAFGNLVTGFNGDVTLGLQGSSDIGGTTSVPASAGFALFQQAYVTQPGTYALTATIPGGPVPSIVSNPFTVNAASFPGEPYLTIAQPVPGSPVSGQPFDVTVTVHDRTGTQPANAYDHLATINLELRDGNGNLLPTGPFLQFVSNPGMQPTDGVATFRVQIDNPSNLPAKYEIVAVMDINAQTVATAPFTVGETAVSLTRASARARERARAAARVRAREAARARAREAARARARAVAKKAAGVGSVKAHLKSGQAATTPGTVNYGLGSLTTNFNTISSLSSYQALPPGGRPYPPVQSFDPNDVPAGGPAPQQPVVARGFSQVPQTNKFWSSLIFPRSRVPSNDKTTPQDSKGNQLFALDADPITAMVNSDRGIQQDASTTRGSDVVTVKNAGKLSVGLPAVGPGLPAHTTITAIDGPHEITVSRDATRSVSGKVLDFPDFAGLGLSYLSPSALFIQPSATYSDPPPPSVPPGQPPVWANPQAPGAQGWQYAYSGNGNPREYQDFSIGLQGVQADGRVLRYSDSTVTLNWEGKDAAGRDQDLQATLGQGMPFVYFTVPTSTDADGTTIQLVTTPKNDLDPTTFAPVPVPVKVTAYDPSTGAPATSGTGPFELEMSYTVHDVADNITQASSTSTTSDEITVVDSTQLAAGMSVVGDGILPGTTITGIVDATHVTLSTTPTATAGGVSLLFNSLAQRSFDNFYGIFLPAGIAWSIQSVDSSGDTVLTARLTARNYFSVATLPAGTPGTFDPAYNTFLPHAYTFVTGSTSSFAYDPTTSTVTTTYRLKTDVMQKTPGDADAGPLQALNAQQYNNLTAGDLQALKAFNVNGQYSYASPHGELLLWDGPQFSTQLTYTGVLPSVPPLPDGGDPIPGAPGTGDAALWTDYLLPILRSVSTQSQSDGRLVLDKIFPNSNNYLQAQSMYGASQLVPILLEISQSTDPGLSSADRATAASYAEQIYDAVKDRMGSWLSANDDDALQLLYYQPATPQESNAPAGSQGWQSLMSILSGFLSSESLNDHQLIAGYFIKVAAFLDQYDSTWGQTTQPVDGGSNYLQGKMGDIVNLMIGDVSNDDRNSKTFPFLRNYDVWDMHSWADGAANDNGGSNLESSSEALNYDSAVILWGQVTGNQSALDLGVSLYTNELDAVQTDWFSIDNQQDPFGHPTDVIPPQYLGSSANGTQRTLVTKVTNNGGSYLGFIGFQTSNVAGIQMLPLSGSSYYLGQDPSFVSTTYTIAQKGASQQGVLPLAPPTYQSVLLPYLALSDPAQALADYESEIDQISPINPGDLIDNNAFNMHWIEVLDAYGQVDPGVTADIPSFAVFKQPSTGVLTFVAENPGAMPQAVQFKDASGNVLLTETVAPFTTMVSQGSGDTPTVVAQQTTPNYAMATPQDRFFLTTDASGQPTLSYGQAGAGEQAVTIDGTKPVQFTIKGLTGTLVSPDAASDFSLWLDPGTRTAAQGSPEVRVTITYDPTPAATPITQTFSAFNMSESAGYVEYRSAQAGGLSPPTPPPTQMIDGSVTVTIVPVANVSKTATVRLRTDAAAQQGRVSYLDLPYDFTTVGVDAKGDPIPVGQLSLGGQTFGPSLPDLNGEPSPGPDATATASKAILGRSATTTRTAAAIRVDRATVRGIQGLPAGPAEPARRLRRA